jgi:Putative beta-barrel porin-2, OmpL-like. bbp2
MRFGRLSGLGALAPLGLALLLTPGAQAQAPAAAPAPDPAPAAPSYMAGPLKFQGYVDGYYSFNANHPASQNNGFDRYFDVQANQFSLNMAGLYMSTDPAPVGVTPPSRAPAAGAL